MVQPNVLVVLSDQQRPDSCGVYGQRLDVTPRLDRLAADGVVFDEAFTVQPVCGPSRAALQTGRYPTTLGCWRNGIALPPGVPTLADRLHGLGYQTGYVFHLEDPVRFEREIKVTIEHGHANHLANEMSSVAYWYADQPAAAVSLPTRAQRKAVRRDNHRTWLRDPASECPGRPVALTEEMRRSKAAVRRAAAGK